MGVRVKTSVPVDEVKGFVRMLVARHGSIHEAGRVYDERYGYKGKYNAQGNGGRHYSGNGSRLFNRILADEQERVSDRTYDQIETLVWS